jgi:cytochrome c oxidase cbb3-type subunit 3
MALLAVAILALLLGVSVACEGGEAGGTVAKNTIPQREKNTTIQKETTPPAADGRVIAGGNPPSTPPMENPFAGDSAAAREGEKLFTVFNCDGCHSGGAVGMIGPSLADGRWRYGGSPAAIYETISAGRPRGMPAFGGVLPEEAIWKIVTYLQSLQPARDQPTVSF